MHDKLAVMNYITGKTIRFLREKKHLTQSELAAKINVSDKAVSKWENDRGLPDIGIIADLAKTLGVSQIELLTGKVQTNTNIQSDMEKTCCYVCPICGNVIFSAGKGSFSCCGISLFEKESVLPDENHNIDMKKIDGEYYARINHPMTKEHYISFIAYLAKDSVQVKKLYPEMDAEACFRIQGKGTILAFCNRHELFSIST